MTTVATPNAPHCPNCGRVMKLVRITPRVGGLAELQTFECRPCGVVLTEAVEDRTARPGTRRQGF
jgi:transposase-like protein